MNPNKRKAQLKILNQMRRDYAQTVTTLDSVAGEYNKQIVELRNKRDNTRNRLRNEIRRLETEISKLIMELYPLD